jgi:hypothetical protein
MMPTFPSPPLKFRTVGFPQYGFKASMSDKACRARRPVKRVPRIPESADTFTPPFARSPCRAHTPLVPDQDKRAASTNRSRRGELPLDPRGPWLRPELCCLQPSALTTTPSASLAGTRRLRLVRLYAAPSLCGHAEATHETFPTFTAALSTRAVDHTPVGPRRPPVTRRRGARLPQLHIESPPTVVRLCQQSLTDEAFRRCIVRVMLRPVRLPCSPDWLRHDDTHASSRLHGALSPSLLPERVATSW